MFCLFLFFLTFFHPGAVSLVATFAESSEGLSLRGTAFHVLGLFSRTLDGRTELLKLGWDSPPSRQATIAVPNDARRLFRLPKYDYEGSAAEALEEAAQSFPLPPVKDEWRPVLEQVGKLSSRVAEREAQPALTRMRTHQPALFTSLGLCLHAYALLENLSYRLATRTFVHNLFSRVPLTNAAWAEVEASAPNFVPPPPAPDLFGKHRASPTVKALRKSFAARRGGAMW